MVKCAVSTIVRILEGVMIPSLLPVPYSILEIQNDFRETAHISNIRVVISIKTEK